MQDTINADIQGFINSLIVFEDGKENELQQLEERIQPLSNDIGEIVRRQEENIKSKRRGLMFLRVLPDIIWKNCTPNSFITY